MIESRLREVLGPDIGIGVETVDDASGLFPDERAAVFRAVPKRQAEFAAGRRAARAALAQIGLPKAAIAVGEKRAPVWPDGILGSITHHSDLAIAIAAPNHLAFGLGIDLTDAAPLPTGTRTKIVPHPEEANLSEIDARLAFAAKEAFFKAAFPSVGEYFDFSAVVFHAPAKNTFSLEVVEDLGPIPLKYQCHGRWFAADDRLVAVIHLAP